MIKLENVTKIYGNKSIKTTALMQVSLSIEDGEFIAIIGTSGCGKTTLLNIIGCMDTLTDGKYFFNEINVENLSGNNLHNFRKEYISFVFQHFELMNNYTIYENVEMPLLARNIKNKERKEKILKYLKMTGIEDLKDKLPSQVSGGQQQRCAIARAMACETEVMIADEPTGALDAITSAGIMELFKELNSNGKTIIIVTHDMNIAQQCGRIIKMSDGTILNT